MKKLLVGTSLALLILVNGGFTARQTNLKFSGVEDQVEVFATPSDMHQHFVDYINSAKSSIVIEQYHFTDPDIAQALMAKPKNVSIVVILDAHALDAKAKGVSDQLQAHSNVTVIPSSSKFSLTHTKAMIIDDSVALITSVNWTTHPDTTRDFGVVTQDPAIIAEMVSVFTADVANAQNQTANTPAVSDPNLLWSPVNAEDKLVALIQSSESIAAGPAKFLYAEVENLGDQAIMAAFAHAAAAGVDVRLVVPECAMGTGTKNYSYFPSMAGVNIHVAPKAMTATAPYIHAKMIVTGAGDAYVGSVNFSYNSTHNDRELGIIFNNQSASQQIVTVFGSDWFSSTTPGTALPDCSGMPF